MDKFACVKSDATRGDEWIATSHIIAIHATRLANRHLIVDITSLAGTEWHITDTKLADEALKALDIPAPPKK